MNHYPTELHFRISPGAYREFLRYTLDVTCLHLHPVQWCCMQVSGAGHGGVVISWFKSYPVFT